MAAQRVVAFFRRFCPSRGSAATVVDDDSAELATDKSDAPPDVEAAATAIAAVATQSAPAPAPAARIGVVVTAGMLTTVAPRAGDPMDPGTRADLLRFYHAHAVFPFNDVSAISAYDAELGETDGSQPEGVYTQVVDGRMVECALVIPQHRRRRAKYAAEIAVLAVHPDAPPGGAERMLRALQAVYLHLELHVPGVAYDDTSREANVFRAELEAFKRVLLATGFAAVVPKSSQQQWNVWQWSRTA